MPEPTTDPPSPEAERLRELWMRFLETQALHRAQPDDGHPNPPATPEDLTPRQLAVASLLARGKSDKQIAAEIGITARRVAQHVDALEYLIHADPSGNVRLQIALWWRDQVPTYLTYAA